MQREVETKEITNDAAGLLFLDAPREPCRRAFAGERRAITSSSRPWGQHDHLSAQAHYARGSQVVSILNLFEIYSCF